MRSWHQACLSFAYRCLRQCMLMLLLSGSQEEKKEKRGVNQPRADNETESMQQLMTRIYVFVGLLLLILLLPILLLLLPILLLLLAALSLRSDKEAKCRKPKERRYLCFWRPTPGPASLFSHFIPSCLVFSQCHCEWPCRLTGTQDGRHWHKARIVPNPCLVLRQDNNLAF